MKLRKVPGILLLILLSLIPTALMIYNISVATGIPYPESWTEVKVTFAATAADPDNNPTRTYPAGSDECSLLAGVLSSIESLPELPDEAATDAYYSLTFSVVGGTETTCRIYGSAERLMSYIRTAQGKVYRLPYRTGQYGSKTVEPAMCRFSCETADGNTAMTEIYNAPCDTAFPLSDFSALSDVKFPGNGTVKNAAYYKDGISASADTADTAYIFVEYALGNDTVMQVGYRFCLFDGK